MAKYTFLKRTGGKVFVNAHHIDIRLPKDYFTLGIARMVGDTLETLGIFRFRVRMTEKGQEKRYILNLPSPITILPQEVFTDKEDGAEAEDAEGVPEQVKVFRMFKGDVFVESESIIRSPKNVEAFANLLHTGHLPKTTYEAVYHQYMQVQLDNKTPLGVPSSTIEGIIAEICRWKRNSGEPFRIGLAKGAKDTDFVMSSLKNMPRLLSTFTGVSFEDIGKSLASGIARKREGRPNRETPMERVMKG